ncbi:hypothetical protein NECAME_08472 [Necator americanus]|uniref:SSD domain-containing protein n=1 Tax=Necator americanus TaxID=51031 RepID=W2TIT9_NECAM|nr:hypothetical protein NECAME_08472 [Necator americanus]ETN81504.1 hypothetical protein NECAME_08472 [Necator americanus]
MFSGFCDIFYRFELVSVTSATVIRLVFSTASFSQEYHQRNVRMKVVAEDSVAKAAITMEPVLSNASDSGKKDTILIRWITRFYHRWALFVADHAILTIVICTILSLVGTAKIVTTPNENDITGYTPYGARARDELDVAGEFFSRGGSGIAIFVLILPKDGGNALRLEVLDEAIEVSSQ